MMGKIRRILAFLTIAFALMMLTVVILEQHNPTMGFFTGTTFRVYQPIFCVLSILASVLLMAGNAPAASDAPRTPAVRREKAPRRASVRPRRESAPRAMREEYDVYDSADRAGEEPYPEEESYEEDEPYPEDEPYEEIPDDDFGEAETLPDDFDWEEFLK